MTGNGIKTEKQYMIRLKAETYLLELESTGHNLGGRQFQERGGAASKGGSGADVITERVDLPAGLSNDLRNGTKIFRGLGLILEWILELALGSRVLVHTE